MKKVTNIYFNQDNLPVFELEDGTQRIARQIPTGNCWMIEFFEQPKPYKHNFKGNNLRCSICGCSTQEAYNGVPCEHDKDNCSLCNHD